MKATGARKVQTKKPNYMSDEAFADLKQALEDALTFERGERRDIPVARIQASRPSKDIMNNGRDRMHKAWSEEHEA